MGAEAENEKVYDAAWGLDLLTSAAGAIGPAICRDNPRPLMLHTPKTAPVAVGAAPRHVRVNNPPPALRDASLFYSVISWPDANSSYFHTSALTLHHKL